MKTILLIEDDSVLANMYSQKFNIEGYEVVVAKDGEEGIEKAKESEFDLVITDIMLPRMSGLEFVEKFKKTHKKSSTPIIAWTNLTDTEDKNKALDLGVSEYLLKANVSLKEIVELVKKYIKS